jgi:type I restriction enzyme R subunit
LDRFALIYLTAEDQNAALPQLHAILDGVIERCQAAPETTQVTFYKALNDYVRLYAFLAQTARFEDDDLEKLYLFGRFLSRKLHPRFAPVLPLEIREQVELESLRVRQTGSGRIDLVRGEGKLESLKIKEESLSPQGDDQESLSIIIQELNHIYGFEASGEEVITVQRVEAKLDESAALKVSAEVNSKENFKLSFENAVKEKFDELLEDNFKLYKKIMDDPDFARNLLDVLFERYLKRLGANGEA